MGFNALHTIQAGNQGSTDEEQLEYAFKNGFILVTHNRKHFYRIHSSWSKVGKKHGGIIVIKCCEVEILSRKLKLFLDNIYPSLDVPFCLSASSL
jgi:predicted nuclease of predicted toxin-antitoxin system